MGKVSMAPNQPIMETSGAKESRSKKYIMPAALKVLSSSGTAIRHVNANMERMNKTRDAANFIFTGRSGLAR